MDSSSSHLPAADEGDPANDAFGTIDWAATPLGPIESWPGTLRFALNLCQNCSLACAIYWGPEKRLIFNRPWQELLGLQSTEMLGSPAPETEHALWPLVSELVTEIFETGQGAFVREQPMAMVRGGVNEETFWNCNLTPLIDEAGAVLGVLNQANEVTRSVLAEKRLSFQVKLADRLRGLGETMAIKQAAIELLGSHLNAARVGYAELDSTESVLTVRREWRSDPDLPDLAGQSARMSDLPAGSLEALRGGEPLALEDLLALARSMPPEQIQVWREAGVRALIVVPLVRDGRLQALFYVHEPSRRAWKRSEVAMARDVAERTWDALERAQAEQLLRDSEDHYRHVVELNPQVSWTSLPDGQLNRVAKRWEEWTGNDGLGDGWAKGIHREDRQRTIEVWAHCVATGETYDIEHRVRQRDGSYRWGRSRAFPRYNDKGEICLWYGTTEDIHERKIGEEHQRLLVNELNHRVKNTLATVQAIAFQTLKGDISLSEARSRFEARLLALSRAHNLLTNQNWEGASLAQVVADATEHLTGDEVRFEASGDQIWLGPKAALALSLAFHELSTNAAKYGALSNDSGKISISWTIDEQSLILVWKEKGGPAVAAPSSRGFGSRLVERGLEGDLGGKASLHFEPDGLRCHIEAALSAIQAREADSG